MVKADMPPAITLDLIVDGLGIDVARHVLLQSMKSSLTHITYFYNNALLSSFTYLERVIIFSQSCIYG